MLRGFSWVLVGVLWGSQVLAGNLQGFLRDDHGAFKTPARPLQKAPLIHPMIITISSHNKSHDPLIPSCLSAGAAGPQAIGHSGKSPCGWRPHMCNIVQLHLDEFL